MIPYIFFINRCVYSYLRWSSEARHSLATESCRHHLNWWVPWPSSLMDNSLRITFSVSKCKCHWRKRRKTSIMKCCRDIYLQRHKARQGETRRDETPKVNVSYWARWLPLKAACNYTINNHTTDHTAPWTSLPRIFRSCNHGKRRRGKKRKKRKKHLIASFCYGTPWPRGSSMARRVASEEIWRFPTCFGYAMWTMGSYGGLAVLLDKRNIS